MRKRNEFVEHLLELLDAFGDVEAKAMFGGYGIYRHGIMFGLVADDVFYLKVDEHNVDSFEERELQPFTYEKRDRTVALSFYEAPDDAIESPHEMLAWAQGSFDAALRAVKKKKGGRRTTRN